MNLYGTCPIEGCDSLLERAGDGFGCPVHQVSWGLRTLQRITIGKLKGHPYPEVPEPVVEGEK